MSEQATTIDCPMRCEIPEGVRLAEVPQPRHNWPDVYGCPNEDCGRWFLIVQPAIPGGTAAFARQVVGMPADREETQWEHAGE